MLELGIDEATIVLQDNTNNSYVGGESWITQAEAMIKRYAVLADFEVILGPQISESVAPAGYTVAYHYGSHNWYLALAYHPDYPRMGVVVKYSAMALDFYLEKRQIKFYQLMHITEDKMYSERLSRIDFTADYIDEDIEVANIYHDLNNKKIGVFDRFDGTDPDKPILRKRNIEYRGFCVKDDIPTIYLGSVQSDVQARIYNKKREQIERKGAKLDKALKVNNWVRLEVIIKKKYAHQITEAMSNVFTDIEFINLIASVIVQKFRFMNIINGSVDVETDFTQMIIDQINNEKAVLRTANTNNYELAKKIEYFYYGSGALTTLYKIYDIWGESAAWDFLVYTLDLVKKYSPSDECQTWILRNGNDYLAKYHNFNDFLFENLPQVIQKEEKGLREVPFNENVNFDASKLYDEAVVELEKKGWKEKSV